MSVNSPAAVGEVFETHSGKPFQPLVPRVYFYADRFESGDTEQRLGVGIAEDDGPAGELSHELDLSERDIQTLFAAVGKLVCPAAARLNADGLQMLARHETVRSPGADEGTALPKSVPGQLDCGRRQLRVQLPMPSPLIPTANWQSSICPAALIITTADVESPVDWRPGRRDGSPAVVRGGRNW